ncbi:hypothetical protein GCM10011490_16050 [Pseudoclavibacter endophyticus]|uniref:Histidine kinase/HSP90-like ATPase domain-containing protein n=1 Tax=Pseudoclavibacter endophyticus TaxID=1778590 RepID=A0A6H9WDM4_9MICO|nr:ATP-binding protein [Pseudoclavibacter endophyticus]KAB1649019.1 hypothetical protein F8O04_01655 [Pseudoclavibacter endophyticus]GGA66174.1 hypothetical protein GCM10011490_16050 [Pseudoclavibacter endophyticus]
MVEASGASGGLEGGGATTARILRVMAIAIGASSVLFPAMLLATITHQWDVAAVWWNVLALGTSLATGLACVLAAIDGAPRRIRVVAGAVAVAYFAVATLRIPGQVAALEVWDAPWFSNVVAVGVAAAGLAFRPAIGIISLLAFGVVAGVARWYGGDEHSVALGLQNGAQTVAFCSIFLVMALSLLRAGRSADGALAEAREEAAAEASRRARRDVVERMDALIHDRVLATLLLAGRATRPAERDAARRSAVGALAALERQRADDERGLTPTEFVWTAQGLVRDLDPEVQFGYELGGDGGGDGGDGIAGPRDEAGAEGAGREIPGDVAEALTSAMLEALRNSFRHADRGDASTTRAVHVAASPDGLVVTVLDDGVGFDTSRVDPQRLGIAGSIRGRMRAIGGRAQVVSVIGQGTRVALSWRREQAVAPEAGAEQYAERPWRLRRRVSPLDLDFWIGPSPGEEAAAATDVERASAAGAPRGESERSAPAPSPAPASGDQAAREANLRRWLARRIQREPLLVFAVLQVSSNVVLATSSEPGLAATWPCIAALALYAVAAGLAVLPGSTPLPLPFSVAVVALTTVVAALMGTIIPQDAGYFAWHFGANTLLLLGLGLRGRIAFAWIGMVAMVVVAGAVMALRDTSLAALPGLFDRNVAVVLVGTVAAFALKRTINRTLAIERARDAGAVRRAGLAAASDERDRILRRFEASALPVLREIAADGVDAAAGGADDGEVIGAATADAEARVETSAEADDARRRRWLATEAVLRDRIRARALDVEPLRGAVRRARERGLRVVVLDDAGDATVPAEHLARAIAWAASRLDREPGPEATVRLRASGGGLTLTIAGADVEEFALTGGAEVAS